MHKFGQNSNKTRILTLRERIRPAGLFWGFTVLIPLKTLLWFYIVYRCLLCEEEIFKPDDEKYEKFDKISEEVENLKSDRENYPIKDTHEKLNREIFCYKEMYKFAKEKQASRQYLLNDILVPG